MYVFLMLSMPYVVQADPLPYEEGFGVFTVKCYLKVCKRTNLNLATRCITTSAN